MDNGVPTFSDYDYDQRRERDKEFMNITHELDTVTIGTGKILRYLRRYEPSTYQHLLENLDPDFAKWMRRQLILSDNRRNGKRRRKMARLAAMQKQVMELMEEITTLASEIEDMK